MGTKQSEHWLAGQHGQSSPFANETAKSRQNPTEAEDRKQHMPENNEETGASRTERKAAPRNRRERWCGGGEQIASLSSFFFSFPPSRLPATAAAMFGADKSPARQPGTKRGNKEEAGTRVINAGIKTDRRGASRPPVERHKMPTLLSERTGRRKENQRQTDQRRKKPTNTREEASGAKSRGRPRNKANPRTNKRKPRASKIAQLTVEDHGRRWCKRKRKFKKGTSGRSFELRKSEPRRPRKIAERRRDATQVRYDEHQVGSHHFA